MTREEALRKLEASSDFEIQDGRVMVRDLRLLSRVRGLRSAPLDGPAHVARTAETAGNSGD